MRRSSASSSGCTAPRCPAPEWAWRCAARSWNSAAAASGWSHGRVRERRSALPCPRRSPRRRVVREGKRPSADMGHQLRDEAPSAYKNIRAVLRAQKDLVQVTRTLNPVLNYKGA
ncbi:MAG: RtcB family protein [Bryobacteraceae bacterium]|nr:RtcB family protein [Bryobacteraceae bacterium]